MEYFRKYLILIRKLDNTEMKPLFIIRMIILTLLGVMGGILMDKFLPFNFIFNMIRGIFAILTGVSSASYILIVSSRLRKNKYMQDRHYVSLRKKFSFRQRTNFAIIIGSFVFLFILLSNKANLVFTFKTSISITIGILLIAFARKDRNEFLKDIYDIPDIRDLEFSKIKKERIKKSKKNK